jgi:hypothetical protein
MNMLILGVIQMCEFLTMQTIISWSKNPYSKVSCPARHLISKSYGII